MKNERFSCTRSVIFEANTNARSKVTLSVILESFPLTRPYGRPLPEDEGRCEKIAEPAVGNARRSVPLCHQALNSTGFAAQHGTEQRPFPAKLPAPSHLIVNNALCSVQKNI